MVFKRGVFRRDWDQGLGTIGWNYRAFTSDPSAAYASINLTTVITPMNVVDSIACEYLEHFRRAQKVMTSTIDIRYNFWYC
jgi:hypothetical protein